MPAFVFTIILHALSSSLRGGHGDVINSHVLCSKPASPAL
jgi:hypothetical protein